MKYNSNDTLNEFAKARMSASHYSPDKILVDLRFLKDWMVGGLTYMLAKGKSTHEITRIAREIAERAQSEEYQNRIFDDPDILNPTPTKIRYADIVSFIQTSDEIAQRSILHISPMTTFLRMLSARTVINLNHSVVEEKNNPITHTINCFPFTGSDSIIAIITTGLKVAQCTRVNVIRRNPEAAPMSAYDKYHHIYAFETEAFLRRDHVRKAFEVTSQITKRWSMADLYGHERRTLIHPIDNERERLSGVMNTMTEFELVPPFVFLPIFPESTVHTIESTKDQSNG